MDGFQENVEARGAGSTGSTEFAGSQESSRWENDDALTLDAVDFHEPAEALLEPEVQIGRTASLCVLLVSLQLGGSDCVISTLAVLRTEVASFDGHAVFRNGARTIVGFGIDEPAAGDAAHDGADAE